MASTAHRVLVTRRVPGEWEQRLRASGAELIAPPPGVDETMPRAEFLRLVRGCHGVLGMLSERWDAEAFDAAGPQLRVLAQFAVGYNNVDLAEATRRGVAVTNTPEVLTNATADIAWALLMAAARRMSESERDLRRGLFTGWGPNDYMGIDLDGKTLGIIGAGRIGTVIARRSRGWDMKVVYTHERPKPDFEAATGATRLALDDLLRTADFISLSVPLTDKTRHLIGARELALMKPTAVLINTARGPVVDEKALVVALGENRIFAAGLDVYEEEPKLAEGLLELRNTVLLPHIGSATTGTRAAMGNLACDNLMAVLEGRRPPNLVNAAWEQQKA